MTNPFDQMAQELAEWIWRRQGLDSDETWCGLTQKQAAESIAAFLNSE